MNFNIFKLIWAIALFSKAAPLGLASGTAKLIAKENQENQVKNMEESKADIEQARTEKVPVEIIERSLDYRKRSKTDKKIQKSFTARMVAALRREFGGHSVKGR